MRTIQLFTLALLATAAGADNLSVVTVESDVHGPEVPGQVVSGCGGVVNGTSSASRSFAWAPAHPLGSVRHGADRTAGSPRYRANREKAQFLVPPRALLSRACMKQDLVPHMLLQWRT